MSLFSGFLPNSRLAGRTPGIVVRNLGRRCWPCRQLSLWCWTGLWTLLGWVALSLICRIFSHLSKDNLPNHMKLLLLLLVIPCFIYLFIFYQGSIHGSCLKANSIQPSFSEHWVGWATLGAWTGESSANCQVSISYHRGWPTLLVQLRAIFERCY